MTSPRRAPHPLRNVLAGIAATAFTTMALTIGPVANNAQAAVTASTKPEQDCLQIAQQENLIKAVCGPDGVYGISKTSQKKAEHLTQAELKTRSLQPADTGTTSVKHSFENNYIEDTTATVAWVYVDSHTTYTGSYYVKLTTNLNGRQGIYSLVLTHKVGGTIIIGNMDVGCRENGIFPLICGDLYPADHSLGSALSWLNKKGNYLENADPYNTIFNSHVQVFGDILPVGTLASSSFTCPDKTGDSVKDRCYFKK